MCNGFVETWEEAKKNRTFIDLTKENDTGHVQKPIPLNREDESAFITPLSSTIYPIPPVRAYYELLQKCFECYVKRYQITFECGAIFNDVFKIHKVGKTEGYHTWHYEKGKPADMDRILAYMTYLQVPKKGGETEFLHQSLRIDPIVGRTLIWPTGFTHMHRGNPPLDGEKMYITGWFTITRADFDDIAGK